MKILLALDQSTKAMDEAVRLARERGASLTALFVLDATWNDFTAHDWLSGSGSRADFLEYVRENEERQAGKTLREFEERAVASGVAFEVKTGAGRVSEEILAEAERGGYDLLVMAVPFRRGLEALRDAAPRVAKDPPCSVFLVK